MDSMTAAAWVEHSALIERLVKAGRLTIDVAADLCSRHGKEAWLRIYRMEHAGLQGAEVEGS